MTIQERVEQAAQSIERWGASPAQIRSAIEKAILLAIEEDLMTRECCKAEREACAMIAEEEVIHWAFSPAKTTEHFKHIAEVIRARSEGEKKGE